MSDHEDDFSRAKRALAQIPRDRLPQWLAEALDMIERDLGLLPRPRRPDQNIPDYLYPH